MKYENAFGFLVLLTAILVLLKVVGLLTVSWTIVLLPLLIPLGLLCMSFILAAGVMLTVFVTVMIAYALWVGFAFISWLVHGRDTHYMF